MFDVVPFPAEILTPSGEETKIPNNISIRNNGFASWCLDAFLQRAECNQGNSPFALTLTRKSTLPTEGYYLEIAPDQISVEASTEMGVVWALTTAVNLLVGRTLPCCQILDAPLFPHRGVHLDCARHFFGPEEVKRIIDGISLAKMNVLHWHLSDDQGWRIESKRFPELCRISRDYFTQQEIMEIVEYAKVRGVEIIPEIDMPGHTTGILAAYPQYSCSGKRVSLAVSGGIYPQILCPGQEKTFAFLEQLLDEIIPLFPGPRFHIGGDEAPKTEWEKCPHCQKRMEDMGFTHSQQLQGYFSRRVLDILKKHGKQAVCWNDLLLSPNVPEDIQVQYWTLQHRKAMEPFLQKGGQWIYSDMFELYFDYPHSMTSLKKVYETAPHLGNRLCGKEDGLQGMECCVWTEHITDGDQLEGRLFPRVLAVAELCWHGKENYRDFEKRVQGMLAKKLGTSISAAPATQWNPTGRKRRQEALEYFSLMNGAMSAEVREQTVQSTKPNREFSQSFMTKFFKTSDLPFLLAAMMRK